ncbi:MAG TPA: hypothetical protein VD978_31700 [Azospirillum sp.]|nr:hypothetical protein [Azospirillum sp.]
MDDTPTPKHAPKHMPGPGAGGAPQNVRDDVIRGDPAAAGDRPPIESPRTNPSLTLPGWLIGGMAIRALLVVVLLVLLVALGAQLLR